MAVDASWRQLGWWTSHVYDSRFARVRGLADGGQRVYRERTSALVSRYECRTLKVTWYHAWTSDAWIRPVVSNHPCEHRSFANATALPYNSILCIR